MAKRIQRHTGGYYVMMKVNWSYVSARQGMLKNAGKPLEVRKRQGKIPLKFSEEAAMDLPTP